ncbi:MAG: transposase [Pseudomonadota bacterium]
MAHSHRLRLGRVSRIGLSYHVRFSTRDRTPSLSELHTARSVIRSLQQEDRAERTATVCFVVMPDHVHWLLTLKHGSLGRSVSNVKHYSARRLAPRIQWQSGFFDHALRTTDSLRNTARYIIANPLRAGLVSSVADYPHWDAVWLNGGDAVI